MQKIHVLSMSTLLLLITITGCRVKPSTSAPNGQIHQESSANPVPAKSGKQIYTIPVERHTKARVKQGDTLIWKSSDPEVKSFVIRFQSTDKSPCDPLGPGGPIPTELRSDGNGEARCTARAGSHSFKDYDYGVTVYSFDGHTQTCPICGSINGPE